MSLIVIVVEEAVFGELRGAKRPDPCGLVCFMNGWMVMRAATLDRRRNEEINDQISVGNELTADW